MLPTLQSKGTEHSLDFYGGPESVMWIYIASLFYSKITTLGARRLSWLFLNICVTTWMVH